MDYKEEIEEFIREHNHGAKLLNAREMAEGIAIIVDKRILTCLRCRHTWIPRQSVQRVCPKCKSAWWNVPKKEVKDVNKPEHC